MTEQELEIIKNNMFIERHEELEDTVIEAVEKQIPKKPIKESLADYLCPICLNYLSFDALNDDITTAPKFCENCGQAIDWNEEKEIEE